jgi:hypothetical protein
MRFFIRVIRVIRGQIKALRLSALFALQSVRIFAGCDDSHSLNHGGTEKREGSPFDKLEGPASLSSRKDCGPSFAPCLRGELFSRISRFKAVSPLPPSSDFGATSQICVHLRSSILRSAVAGLRRTGLRLKNSVPLCLSGELRFVCFSARNARLNSTRAPLCATNGCVFLK